jgi:predicted transcriptional regulator
MTKSSIRRDLLISIRPTHVEKIVAGLKTVELRRRFSEDVAAGAVILIYSTSPTRAIIGSASISGVRRLQLKDLWDQHGDAACIDRETFDAYFSGLAEGYAILLEDVRQFERHVAAADLKERFGFVAPQSFMYLRQEYYLSLSQIRSERIGDAVRRDVALRISVRRFELRAESVRPCPATDACGPRCDMSCTIAVGAEGAVRQAQRHGRAPLA